MIVETARDLLGFAAARLGRGEDATIAKVIDAAVVLLDFEARRQQAENCAQVRKPGC